METIHEIDRQIAELQKRKAELETGRGKAIDDLVHAISKLRDLGMRDRDIITAGILKPGFMPLQKPDEFARQVFDRSKPTQIETQGYFFSGKKPTPEEIKPLIDAMKEKDWTINDLVKEKKYGNYQHLWWLFNHGELSDKVKRDGDRYHLKHRKTQDRKEYMRNYMAEYRDGRRPRGLVEEIHKRKEAKDNAILALLDKPLLAAQIYSLIPKTSPEFGFKDVIRSRLSRLTKEGKIIQIKEGSAHKTQYVRANVILQAEWKNHKEDSRVQPPAPGEDGKTWRKGQIKRILANGGVWASNAMIDTLADSALGFSIAKKAVQYKLAQLTSDFYFRQKKNVAEARLPAVLVERFGGYDAALREVEQFVFSNRGKGEITAMDWAKFLYLGEEKALATWDWFVFYAAKVLQVHQDLGTDVQILKDKVSWKPLLWKEVEVKA